MKNKKIKILIVDDHPALRSTMIDVLNEEGFETDHAKNGETGLSKCLEHSYDFVLIDVQMPLMSGVDVFRQLKEKKEKLGSNGIGLLSFLAKTYSNRTDYFINSKLQEYSCSSLLKKS